MKTRTQAGSTEPTHLASFWGASFLTGFTPVQIHGSPAFTHMLQPLQVTHSTFGGRTLDCLRWAAIACFRWNLQFGSVMLLQIQGCWVALCRSSHGGNQPSLIASFSSSVPSHCTTSIQVLCDLCLPHLSLHLHCADSCAAKVSSRVCSLGILSWCDFPLKPRCV